MEGYCDDTAGWKFVEDGQSESECPYVVVMFYFW
jgi:hypothetical protein